MIRWASGTAKDFLRRVWKIIQTAFTVIGELEILYHTFFYYRIVVLMGKFIEYVIVHMLRWKFSIFEASSFCTNVVPSLTKVEHYGFFYLCGVIIVVIWTIRQKEFYGGEKFQLFTTDLFFKHQLEVKIWTEKRRFSPSEFGKKKDQFFASMSSKWGRFRQ